MHRKLLSLAGALLLFAATGTLAQEPEAAQPAVVPAATQSEMDCSGFIAGTPVSNDLYVLDGADNDFREPLHQFSTGNFVYLRSRSGQGFAVGSEYSLVRSAKELMRIKWYPSQGASVRSLGHPYEDMGRVKVTSVTPYGAVAEVTFTCGPIRPGDIALPYQPRAIPEYTPTTHIDRFAPPNGKMVGAITAAANNGAGAGQGRIVYINLGQEDGAKPGQRYRIFRIFRERLDAGFWALPETPRETIGELVILSAQERSSVAMVVNSLREITLGDGIEATLGVATPKAQVSASSAQIDCGGSARLTWSSSDAVAGEISGVGEVPASGDREIQPKETTTYKFTAWGPQGTTTSSATVNVNNAVQASLEVSPAEISYRRVGTKVVEQGSATIKWSTSNADSVTLEPFGKVDPSGSRTVQATTNQTASGPVNEISNYTLSASNACGGSVTRTATLRVAGSIGPSIAEATIESLLTSIYFPTAYPLEDAPEVGLVRSQRESFSRFAEGVKNYLQLDPQARIRLEGNADQRGSGEYNEALAERRVEIVKNFLVSAGIPAGAVETRAFGKSQNLDPAAVKALEEKNPNKPPVELVGFRERVDWWAHNRRVDIVLAPGGQLSSQYYPYAASDFEILWQAPRPSRKRVEEAQ